MCEYCEGKKAFVAEYTGKGIHTMKQNLNFILGEVKMMVLHI